MKTGIILGGFLLIPTQLFAQNSKCDFKDLRRKSDAIIRAHNCEKASSIKECQVYLGLLLPGVVGGAALLDKMGDKAQRIRSSVPICTVAHDAKKFDLFFFFVLSEAQARSCISSNQILKNVVDQSLKDISAERARAAAMKTIGPDLQAMAAYDDAYSELGPDYREKSKKAWALIDKTNEAKKVRESLIDQGADSERIKAATKNIQALEDEFIEGARQWRNQINGMLKSDMPSQRRIAQKIVDASKSGSIHRLAELRSANPELWKKLYDSPRMNNLSQMETELSQLEKLFDRNEKILSDLGHQLRMPYFDTGKGIQTLLDVDFFSASTRATAEHAANVWQWRQDQELVAAARKGSTAAARALQTGRGGFRVGFRMASKAITKSTSALVASIGGPLGIAAAVAGEMVDVGDAGKCSGYIISEYVKTNYSKCGPQLEMNEKTRQMLELDEADFKKAMVNQVNCDFVNEMYDFINPPMVGKCESNQITAQRGDGVNLLIQTNSNGQLKEVTVDRREVPFYSGKEARNYMVPPKVFHFDESGEFSNIEILSSQPKFEPLKKYSPRDGNRITPLSLPMNDVGFFQIQALEMASCCFKADSRPSDADCARYGITTAVARSSSAGSGSGAGTK